MRVIIEINNLTFEPLNQDFLKKCIKFVLKKQRKKDIYLSVAIVGEKRMRKINKKYRKKDKATDVLSFPEDKVLLEKFRIDSCQKIQGLGEIIICLQEVKKNAKTSNLLLNQELSRVIIHGVLHLLGYDHEKSVSDEKKMKEKQENYLSQFLMKTPNLKFLHS